MQQMLYDDSPYLVEAYYDDIQAYRSDRFTNFTPQPAPDGVLLFQYGEWSYLSAKPVSSASEGTQPASTSSSPGWFIPVGVLVGIAVIVGLVALFLRRGRDNDLAENRE